MSFETLTVLQLKKICKELNIDILNAKTKKDYLDLLAKENISYDVYLDRAWGQEDASEKPKEEIVVKDETKATTTLAVKLNVKMAAYTIDGFRFDDNTPYHIVDRSMAEDFVKRTDGILVIADPAEVASFYGVSE